MMSALIGMLALAGTPDGWSATGKLSRVRLVEVARITAAEGASLKPPARDGLRFILLVTRIEGASGYFTLAEPRHFEVAAVSYPMKSQMRSEPETNIYDLPEFRSKVRPDLSALQNVTSPEDTSVLSVVIGGPALTARVNGRIRFEVGWGEKTEEFWFSFNVPERRPKSTARHFLWWPPNDALTSGGPLARASHAPSLRRRSQLNAVFD